MPNQTKISVIVVTYNAIRWADKCFGSLRNSTAPLDVIVIDNGSTDGTQDFIKSSFPEVDFIQSTENLGFGKANNIGIEKAYRKGADFFYLMNQDAWIFPETVSEMLKVFQNFPHPDEIGILSPMHLDGSEKKLDIFLDKYIAHNFEKTRMISDFYFNKPKPFYEINFINAAHWLIPRRTIETVGGFNPYFFHYGEDNEYVNRVHFHGKKVILSSGSRAVHDGNQNLSKVNVKKFPPLTVETHIMNPNDPNAWSREKASLRQSILKNTLLGNFGLSKELKQKLNKIKKEEDILHSIKAKTAAKGTTFLDI